MPRPLLALLLCLAWSNALGCGGRNGSAATLPDGSKVAIVVMPDRNLAPEIGPKRRAQLQQLLSWMEDDLIGLIEKTGYVALRNEDPALSAAPNRYLLRFQVTEYESMSRAVRAFPGASNGMAQVDTEFEVIGQGDVVVASGVHSAQAPDWAKAARKVNLRMVDAANGRIRLEH
jgi:hypothetical protein